ncbi:MAG: carbon starvation CstA family protein, partial [Verrucomicrobiales bacterium]
VLASNPLTWLTNKHGATLFAIALAFLVAYIPAPGKPPGTGGLNLWPLFGATNQLLGGLAFLVILFWMWRRNLPIWFVAIPACFMLILPGVAMGIELFRPGGWLAQGNLLLVGIGLATLLLELWMIFEALVAWPKARGVLEEALPPLKPGAGVTDGGRSC